MALSRSGGVSICSCFLSVSMISHNPCQFGLGAVSTGGGAVRNERFHSRPSLVGAMLPIPLVFRLSLTTGNFGTLGSNWVENDVAKLAIYYCQGGLSTGFWSIPSGRGPTVHLSVHHTGESGDKRGEIRSQPEAIFSNADNRVTTGAKIEAPERSNS